TVTLLFLSLLFWRCEKNEVVPNPISKAYGLGNTITKQVSNNDSYQWHFDQGNSGIYSGVNCGPTSVTMVIKWAEESFDKTPQDARNTYRSSGGWWYTSDIINYLNMYSVSNYTISLTNINLLKDKIDNGHIVILCLDMYFVNAQTNNAYHVDKFYNASTQGWGHFIVIKGYWEVDGNTFFEAYDPFTFGVTYNDNSLKGENRYYRASNLDEATNHWWDYAIVITRPGSPTNQFKKDPNVVDTRVIAHRSGR
ncbi:MAG TPA: hypothetical protein DGG95_17420, partial [Cytophagales bacterium]|nr:hypothetical protein [Cytophagales bacterium]